MGAFEQLEAWVQALGLGKVGVVALDDPQLERARQAYRAFLAQDLAGEMGYLEKNQELREDASRLLPGAKSALVFATGYRGEQSEIARYAQGQDYHRVLDSRLRSLVERLEARWPDATFLRCVDTKPVLERAFAQVAGLGFIGKHGCVIVPGWGSYVFLSVLLTTLGPETWEHAIAPLASQDEPWDRCASCMRCLEACPTDAFLAPGKLDPRRCISYLTIEHRGEIDEDLAQEMGQRVAGCDVCQEVCPYNLSPSRESRIDERQWLPPAPSGLKLSSLVQLGKKGSSQYRRWVKDTALNRIPRASMLRNVLIAMGNAGDLDEEGIELLALGRAHSNPAVAQAARWATKRLQGECGPSSESNK